MADNEHISVVFMGTPDFAVTALSAIADAGFHIACCVTQPDRAKGRGGHVSMPPVKTFAMERNIPVLQPDRVGDKTCVQALRTFKADVFVVAAFGQILPREVLDIPPMGCINIHASLLPKFRGASPIQHALLSGEKVTGITIMRMDEGCDTGDILLQRNIAIAKDDTGGSLFEKLAVLGGKTIVEALPLIAENRLKPVKQNETQATLAPKLTKEMGIINWQEDTRTIVNRIRAFYPWPCAGTRLNGKSLKILQATEAEAVRTETEPSPGCVLSATKQGLFVKTGDGVLQILRLQPEGKKEMDVSAFLNGHAVESGTVLGKNT